MALDKLTLSAVVCRSEALLSSDLGDEIVMMDIDEGSYYGLQTVAARIWTLAEKPLSIGSLCDQLAAEYRVSQEQCQQEVMAFLGELLERRIVVVVNSAHG